MKNLLNLNGAQKLSNEEQKAINGGHAYCRPGCAHLYLGAACTTSTDCRHTGICQEFGGMIACNGGA